MIIGNQPDIHERDIFGKKIFQNNYSQILCVENTNYNFKNLNSQITTIESSELKYKNKNIQEFYEKHTLIALTGQVLIDSRYRNLYESGKLPDTWLILYKNHIKLTKDYAKGIFYQTGSDNVDVIIEYVDADDEKQNEILNLDLYLIK